MSVVPPSSRSSTSALTAGSSSDAFDTSAASTGITLTASGSANTKGAWVTLIASASAQIDALALSVIITSAAARDYLVDIGIGPAASEVVIVPNILVSDSTASFVGEPIILPVRIAAGTRVAARVQSNTGAATIQVGGQAFSGGWPLAQAATAAAAYGAATASTRGTSVDPGAVANTKGAWTQIAAATSFASTALLVAVGSQQNSVRSNANHLLDIGTGAAASEVVLIPNLVVIQDAATDRVAPGLFGPFPVTIPSGTRLAARQQSDITDATDRLIDVALYAFG